MLRLPAHVVDLSQPDPELRAPAGSDPHVLRPSERRSLLAMERSWSQPTCMVERVVPLVDGRWAVCRRLGSQVLWRVATVSELERLNHPAWLWVSDDWLDPQQAATASFVTPARLPLRTLLAHAGALHPSGRQIIKGLAAAVRQLRAGQPTAVLVAPEVLEDASHPARAFVLALLTLMPPAWRAPLRACVGPAAATEGRFNLLITDEGLGGYHLIDLDAPGDEGTDLVAFYVRERLLADDPESLEAASFRVPPHPDPASRFGDPWADAVAAVLREPPSGVAEVDDDALAADAEGAARALSARIAARTPLAADVGCGTLLERLVQISRARRDPRPWRAMLSRSAADRAQAVLALLDTELQANGPLIDALAATYPRGAELVPWLDQLLSWLRAGVAPDQVVNAVQDTLLRWPAAQSAGARASVWSEVVRGLVGLGDDEQAMAALTSPVARQLVRDGAGPALASLWGVIPEAFRDPKHLEALVRLLAEAEPADEGLVALFEHTKGREEERATLFRAWHAVGDGRTHDPLYTAVRGTPFLRDWLAGLFAIRDPLHAADTIAAVAAGSSDELWIAAEAAMVQALALVPSQRFFALPALIRGVDALERVAPLRLLDAVRRPFPAPEITDVARLLLTASQPSPLWSLVAVAAAPVDHFDDETLDAAVVDFCAMKEPSDEVQEVALICVEQLGMADGFDPLDHARWIVRISLAPDGSRITPELTLSLVKGVLAQTDGVERLEAIALALLDLPPEHPALLAFVHFLLPRAFDEGVPERFRDAIPLEAVPTSLQAAWARTCGHVEDPKAC